jgi:hypothetical protein
MSTIIPWSDVIADPERLAQEMQARRIIHLPDVGYTVAPSSSVVLVAEDDDEAEDMASFRKDVTGIDNTIFVSPKGNAQHGPRIKIAVDPPDTLNPRSKQASMAIHDYGMTGEYLQPRIVEQAKEFIDRNRDALRDYWDHKIDTAELTKRLKSSAVPGA